MKKCTKCNDFKEENQFYKTPHGNTRWCKECLKTLSRERVADGRDKESKIRYNLRNGIEAKQRIKYTDIQRVAVDQFNNIRKRAIIRGLEFNITKEWVITEFEAFCNNNYYETEAGSPFKPSVDRLDAKRGYTLDNVRVIWLIENLCRNTFTDDQVLEFCKRKLEREA
jgi:hypothetical protein